MMKYGSEMHFNGSWFGENPNSTSLSLSKCYRLANFAAFVLSDWGLPHTSRYASGLVACPGLATVLPCCHQVIGMLSLHCQLRSELSAELECNVEMTVMTSVKGPRIRTRNERENEWKISTRSWSDTCVGSRRSLSVLRWNRSVIATTWEDIWSLQWRTPHLRISSDVSWLWVYFPMLYL